MVSGIFNKIEMEKYAHKTEVSTYPKEKGLAIG